MSLHDVSKDLKKNDEEFHFTIDLKRRRTTLVIRTFHFGSYTFRQISE